MEQLIKNKRIAFVAMGASIKGKGLGKEIDSFDTVYRTNFYPIPEHLHKDYGSRCDILSVLKGHYRQGTYANTGLNTLIRFSRMNCPKDEGINYFLIGKKFRANSKRKIFEATGKNPRNPTKGLLAYFLCQKYGAKEIKFFGVTGYQNKDNKVCDYTDTFHYTEEYVKSLKTQKDLSVIDMANYKPHNFAVQNEFIVQEIKAGRLSIDPFSKEYFKF